MISQLMIEGLDFFLENDNVVDKSVASVNVNKNVAVLKKKLPLIIGV